MKKKQFSWGWGHTAAVGLFWGGTAGFYAAWPAFQGSVNPYIFAGVSVALGAAIALAHVLKRPGAE